MRQMNMSNTVIVVLEKTDTGYSAYCELLPGCIATGDDINDVQSKFKEAAEFHLEGLKANGYNIPKEFKTDFLFEFKLDLEVFFEWFSGVMTKSGVARITNMNQSLISQYANGLKKPSQKQLREN